MDAEGTLDPQNALRIQGRFALSLETMTLVNLAQSWSFLLNLTKSRQELLLYLA